MKILIDETESGYIIKIEGVKFFVQNRTQLLALIRREVYRSQLPAGAVYLAEYLYEKNISRQRAYVLHAEGRIKIQKFIGGAVVFEVGK
jgi:hypothetical protein